MLQTPSWQQLRLHRNCSQMQLQPGKIPTYELQMTVLGHVIDLSSGGPTQFPCIAKIVAKSR